MSTRHHSTRIALAVLASAATVLLSGCIATFSGQHTAAVQPQAETVHTTTAPDKPTATLPNQPGRVYPNQARTYAPAPRTLEPSSTPDLSWMPQDPEPITEIKDLFSLCEELPEEVANRIGLTPVDEPYDNIPFYKGCDYTIDSTILLNIVTDHASYDKLAEEGWVLGDATDSLIPGAVYSQMPEDSDRYGACALGVYTPRGRVYIDASGTRAGHEFEYFCPIARDHLEALFSQPEVRAAIWRE